MLWYLFDLTPTIVTTRDAGFPHCMGVWYSYIQYAWRAVPCHVMHIHKDDCVRGTVRHRRVHPLLPKWARRGEPAGGQGPSDGDDDSGEYRGAEAHSAVHQ